MYIYIYTTYRVFYKCWNKTMASPIFTIDFILFLFSDDSSKIVDILIYLIMIWTMK